MECKKQGAKKLGHCYSKREKAAFSFWITMTLFFAPCFLNPYLGPYFQGHKPTYVFKTWILGVDLLGECIYLLSISLLAYLNFFFSVAVSVSLCMLSGSNTISLNSTYNLFILLEHLYALSELKSLFFLRNADTRVCTVMKFSVIQPKKLTSFMSFSSHFRFLLVLAHEVTKMFIYIF